MSNEDFDSSASDGVGGSDIASGIPGSDEYTETTHKSWLQKLISGVMGIFFGFILVIGSGWLLFWNEGRSAKTIAALNEGASQVVSIANTSVDAANEGKLVHVTGDAGAAQAARDADFGFDAKALRLTRKVEMFQWEEEKHSETQKKLGGGEETVTRYTYKKSWSDKAIDSSRFRDAANHRNPAMPQVASRSFYASDAKVGAFGLNETVLSHLSATEKFDAPANALAEARNRLGARARVEQGIVYAGANPADPAIGDVRVSWQMLPAGPVSVVARQTQSTFSPWTARNGNTILLAETGTKDAALLFQHGQDENKLLTWILRLFGVVFMFFGFCLMLSLLEAIADVIPFLGDVVGAGTMVIALLFTMIVAPVIIAVAWLFYRPIIAGAVLAGGFAFVWGLRELGKKRALARAPAPMPQGMPPAQAPAVTSFLQGGSPLTRR